MATVLASSPNMNRTFTTRQARTAFMVLEAMACALEENGPGQIDTDMTVRAFMTDHVPPDDVTVDAIVDLIDNGKGPYAILIDQPMSRIDHGVLHADIAATMIRLQETHRCRWCEPSRRVGGAPRSWAPCRWSSD